MTTQITVDSKIKTVEDGKAFIVDFAKNPPKTPLSAVKMFSDATGVTGSLTGALSAVIPGFSFVLPAVSGILSLFGDGSPSIGEVTLDAIKNLSGQLNKVAEQLQTALTEEIKESAQKTIEIVLAGQTEIAKQQSAISVISSIIHEDILDKVAAEKNEAYTLFLAETKTLQENTINDLRNMVLASQKSIDIYYDSQMSEILRSLADLIAPFMDLFDEFLVAEKEKADMPVQSRAVQNITTIQDKTDLPGIATNYLPLIAVASIAFMFMSKSKKN